MFYSGCDLNHLHHGKYARSAGWSIPLGSSSHTVTLEPSLFLSLASPTTRESKELADFARIHPSGCAANGLNSNLMVTGGPALAGSGRWSADPASHLAAHPWLPRTGSPSMWLAGHPYGECPARERCVRGVLTVMQSRESVAKCPVRLPSGQRGKGRRYFGAIHVGGSCLHPLSCECGVSSSRTWSPFPAPGHDPRLSPCNGGSSPFRLPVCQRPAVRAACCDPQRALATLR